MMSCARATHDPSEAVSPSVLRTIQQATCYPATDDAKDWPVKVVYLHGLFLPSTNSDYYGTLENDNRIYLESLARRLQIKIAVPVSTTLSSQGFRMWNGVSLAQIESMAASACGGPLASTRAIVGFSNGGYAARNISYLSCNQTRSYSKVIAIGLPESDGGSCGTYVHVAPHVFPPADPNFFDNQLAGLSVNSLVSVLVRDYRR